MNHSKKLTRRSFLTQTGVGLATASAALAAPNSLLAGVGKSAQQSKKGQIKISMYLYTLFDSPHKKEDWDIVEICRRTKALGIDALDFIGTGYNKSWKEIRMIADDHGLKTICYTKGIGDFESPNAATRKKSLDEFKANLEIAHTLGAPKIMMNQGGRSSGNDSATNRKWFIETMHDALPIATSEGIEVTIETHNSPVAPFRNSSDFSEAIAALPDFRVCFDSGNTFGNGEDPLQSYLNNTDHITHVHFKDYAGGTVGNASRICPPGTGLIDMPGIIKAMKAQGYNGYINLEKGGPDGFEVYKRSMEIIKPLIA